MVDYSEIKNKKKVKEINLRSRHEQLFWFSSPGFLGRNIHFSVFVAVQWFVFFTTQYMFFTDDWTSIGFGVLMYLFWFFIINLNIRSIRLYSIITNTEMMKDYPMIREAVYDQRERKSMAYIRLYRLLKSIQRQSQVGNSERVAKHEVLVEHMEEMFDMLDQDRDRKISVQHLPELVHLMS